MASHLLSWLEKRRSDSQARRSWNMSRPSAPKHNSVRYQDHDAGASRSHIERALHAIPPFTNVEDFIYDELDLTQDVIRVLKVHTDPSDTPIRCTLRHVALGTSHTCLSYRWGTETASETIVLNERLFKVQTNLLNFLCEIRASGDSGELWIDAISIDQANKREQNHQVHLMAHIYQSATLVYMWLGRDAVLSTALTMGLSFMAQLLPPEETGNVDWPETVHRVFDNFRPSDGEWEELYTLCQNPYFERLWVVQEVRLARHAVLLCGGGNRIGWRVLCHFFDYFSRARINYLDSLGRGEAHPLQIPTTHLTDGRWDSAIERVQLVSLGINAYLSNRPSLRTLLVASRGKSCTDPRDRVYALLGLAAQGSSFTIDYEEDLGALVLRTMDFIQANSFDVRRLVLDIFSVDAEILGDGGQFWDSCPEYVLHDFQTLSGLEHGDRDIEIWLPRLKTEASALRVDRNVDTHDLPRKKSNSSMPLCVRCSAQVTELILRKMHNFALSTRTTYVRSPGLDCREPSSSGIIAAKFDATDEERSLARFFVAPDSGYGRRRPLSPSDPVVALKQAGDSSLAIIFPLAYLANRSLSKTCYLCALRRRLLVRVNVKDHGT